MLIRSHTLVGGMLDGSIVDEEIHEDGTTRAVIRELRVNPNGGHTSSLAPAPPRE